MSYVYKPIVPNSFSQEELKLHKTFNFNTSSYGLDIVHYTSGSEVLSGSHYSALRMSYYLSGSPASFNESQSPFHRKFTNPYHNQGEWWYEKHIHRNKFFTTGSLFSISQQFIGEGIKRGSFKLVDNSKFQEIIIVDDNYGNLYATNATVSQSGTTSISSSDNYVGNIFY